MVFNNSTIGACNYHGSIIIHRIRRQNSKVNRQECVCVFYIKCMGMGGEGGDGGGVEV